MTAVISQAPQYAKLPLTDANRWFPSTWDRGPNWLVWLGVISSFVAIFIKLWTPININRIPETLYTLPFFYALYKNFYWLKHDRIIHLFFAALLWPVVAFGIHYLQDPETALKYQKLDNLARLFLFVPIAWWLGGSTRTMGLYLGTAFSGLLLACLLDPNLAGTLKNLAAGKRIDFNILNAQHVALYFSIALIGLLSVSAHAFSTIRSWRQVWKPVLWLLAVIICGTIIVGTQTRAAWLALTVCAGLWVLQIAWRYRNKTPGAKFLTTVLILSACSAFLGYQFSDRILQRVQSEQETLNRVLTTDWDNIPYSSIGVRINTWIEAAHWISQKPIVGWGGDIRRDVFNQSERFPNWIKNRFGHFHNSLVEFSLAYGLPSLAIILWPFYYLVRYVGLSKHSIPAWVQSFSLYAIAILLIMNLFESYFFFWSGIYAITAVLVVPYTLFLNQYSKNSPQTNFQHNINYLVKADNYD